MNVTWLGHACFLVEVKGKRLLFDPFISDNPQAKNLINPDEIKTDYVLISHGHGDHTLDAERIIKNNKAFLISNNEIVTLLGDKGIKNAHPLNTGGKAAFDFGTVKLVNAVHSSVLPDSKFASSGGGFKIKRRDLYPFAGNPAGFVIKSDENSFYFAGDTGLTYDMKLIGDYTPVDFAFLPIGGNFTMDVEDAIIASDFIKCNKIIGMHYNTWDIIHIDTTEAVNKFKKAGKELILFNINETKRF